MENIDFNELLKNEILDDEKSSKLRNEILELVTKYTNSAHKEKEFIPGKSIIPVSGKVFNHNELKMLVASSLDFWLTSGRFTEKFESQMKEFLGVNFVITTNSGSSANLLALSSLTSEQLGDRALQPGDEVISVASAFPTTVNPILQNNLTPVFIDMDLPTYQINTDSIENAISKKTKAIMIAHTLGNSFNINKVINIAKNNNL